MNTTKLVMAYAIVILSLSINLGYTQQQSESAICTQLHSVTQLCSGNGNDIYPSMNPGVPGKRGPRGEKGDSSTYVENEEKNLRFASKLASLHEQLNSVQGENQRLKADLEETKDMYNSENQRLKADLDETKEMCNNETQRLKADLDETKEIYNNKITGVEDRILIISRDGDIRLKSCGLLQRPSKIEDSRFSASSYWDSATNDLCAPYHGRLFSTSGETFWHSGTNPDNQWIQVDLEENHRIKGVVTQGRHNADQWSTSYSVSYKTVIGGSFRAVEDESGAYVVFQGNTDRNTPVINNFPQPITGRYFRINVLTYHGYTVIRFDLLTC